jgi:hypothetical protein
MFLTCHIQFCQHLSLCLNLLGVVSVEQRSYYLSLSNFLLTGIISSGLFVKSPMGQKLRSTQAENRLVSNYFIWIAKSDGFRRGHKAILTRVNLAAAIIEFKIAAGSYRHQQLLKVNSGHTGISAGHQRQNRNDWTGGCPLTVAILVWSRQDFPQLILSYNQVSELLPRTANTRWIGKEFYWRLTHCPRH